jgi:hypothetical protein
MRVKIDTPGGTEEIELDLRIESLSMRELVRLEENIGSDTFDALMAGKLTDTQMARPSFIRALLYSKLRTIRPDLEIDNFDVDLEDLTETMARAEVVSLPKAGGQSS